jgi:hypothetical protein
MAMVHITEKVHAELLDAVSAIKKKHPELKVTQSIVIGMGLKCLKLK